ncbi:MAG: hypothetical protein EOP84_26155 [Verrucomicrobiaceae bacterium]|nr:MAG: hypothetical protein EOP84_26155 [Verrucomicrobiaceae bacterium]
MQMFAELSPDEWLDSMEKKLQAVNALRLLVEGPAAGKPDPVGDATTWVHIAFHTYRNAMPDNHPALHPLARIEHDFIAALGALNFDDQTRQLRQAFQSLQMFHHVHR